MATTNTGEDAALIARAALAMVEATIERLAIAGNLTREDVGIIAAMSQPTAGTGRAADAKALADHITTVLSEVAARASV